MRLDPDDVGDERPIGVGPARRKRAERAQGKQGESSESPQHAINVGMPNRRTRPSNE
jgi:hypothetical protein